jgi:hypothetical protein
VAKRVLLGLLDAKGAGAVLKNWTGTHAEAREAIEADPREYFVLNPECDSQREDGSCAGHEQADPQAGGTR